MIYRIDVKNAELVRSGEATVDPVGESIRHQIAEFGMNVGPIETARVFLIDTDATREQIARVAGELLADPVVERAEWVSSQPADTGKSRIEVHLKPGVMDPVAASTEMAIRDMGLSVREVRTGRAYLIEGTVAREELKRIANRVLANGVVESVHFEAFVPKAFPAGQGYRLNLRHASIRGLDDGQLARVSREGHLFLSLPEMKAIQAYYQQAGREPTDVELETLAQTWSEHCVHKTLKSAVDLEVKDEAGKVVERRHYGNLIKETIFKSTMELMQGTGVRGQGSGKDEFCLSVFVDNAGVIVFDDRDAVCFKVETHNHPSAIEPYGGSATGIGGVIRDILGTGLAAKPIANTDVFCVGYPDYDREKLPKGVIHPKRILRQVVAGVRDYGNRMGIPTVNGAVYFDNRYLGNPLVFCGCVGLIPRHMIQKQSRKGDAIVVMGGRTGRDGIHGATFSSAELTDTHADEFSHAVQIGNAITEKKMTEVVLQARDRGLYTAITDCGAGGLSSAVGEMGEKLGALVELDKVPLKYAGLRYDEIWISEAQERMVLAVPQEKVKAVLDLSAGEDVEATVIGYFGTEGAELILRYAATEVGRLSMDFLHHGLPKRHTKAVAVKRSRGASPVPPHKQSGDAAGLRDIECDVVTALQEHYKSTDPGEFVVKIEPQTKELSGTRHGQPIPRAILYGIAAQPVRRTLLHLIHEKDVKFRLLKTLSHPNVASKHWIIRQYDHEVQGGSVIKPLTGPRQVGPSDAAVLRPKLGSYRGIAIGCGMSPQVEDPYDMAIASIDEAIRNVVAVGADPAKIAILDNFCWPSVEDEVTMGALVRACEACYDAAKTYGIPFISGKDSLNNQFTNQETREVIRIPNTLLISAIAVIEDVRKCVTMDLKKAGSTFGLIRPHGLHPDLKSLAAVHRFMAEAIRSGAILSCHDVSDGGVLVAAAEMCIASGLGLSVDLSVLGRGPFDECQGKYLVEFNATNGHVPALPRCLDGVEVRVVGGVTEKAELTEGGNGADRFRVSIEEMTAAWRGTLDW